MITTTLQTPAHWQTEAEAIDHLVDATIEHNQQMEEASQLALSMLLDDDGDQRDEDRHQRAVALVGEAYAPLVDADAYPEGTADLSRFLYDCYSQWSDEDEPLRPPMWGWLRRIKVHPELAAFSAAELVDRLDPILRLWNIGDNPSKSWQMFFSDSTNPIAEIFSTWHLLHGDGRRHVTPAVPGPMLEPLPMHSVSTALGVAQ